MGIGEYIFYLVIAFSLILLLITGITLIRRGRASRQKNIVLLGIIDIFVCLSYFLIAFTEFWIYINIQMVFIQCLYLIFIKTTFYQKSNSIFRKLLIITISFGSVCIIFAIAIAAGVMEKATFERTIDVICTNIAIIPVFLWYSKSANTARQKLAEKNVEPWILARLRILSISAFIGAFIQISDFLRLDPSSNLGDPNNFIGLTVFYIQSTIAVICSLFQYFAWMMPQKLKSYFNRNHTNDEDIEKLKIMPDEEIFRQLKEDSTKEKQSNGVERGGGNI
jgi:hypothetical protein